MSLFHLSQEAEIHTIVKIWEKWITMLCEKYRKAQTAQSYGFLTIFAWSRNPYNSQDMKKVNSYSEGKTWEKQISMHSKVKGFLHISRETEIQAIPKPWDEWIPILRNKYGETQTIS